MWIIATLLILALAAATFVILSALSNHITSLQETLVPPFSDITNKIADVKASTDAAAARADARDAALSKQVADLQASQANAPSETDIANAVSSLDAVEADANRIAADATPVASPGAAPTA